MSDEEAVVKIYNAEELLKTTKSVVITQNQMQIKAIVNTIMAGMAEEAAQGKYALELTFEETPSNVVETITVILRELGYRVSSTEGKTLVSWNRS